MNTQDRFKRGFNPSKAGSSNSAESKGWKSLAKGLLQTKLNFVVAVAFILFAAGSVSVAHSEISVAGYDPIVSSAQQKSNGQVLAAASFGYNQPVCNNGFCLNYHLQEGNTNGTNGLYAAKIDYTLPFWVRNGAVRENGELLARDLSGSNTLYTRYVLKPNTSYTYTLYYNQNSSRERARIQFTTPSVPATSTCSYPEPAGDCYYVASANYNSNTFCGLVLTCPTNPPQPPTYGYSLPDNGSGAYFAEGWIELFSKASPNRLAVRGWAYDMNQSVSLKVVLYNETNGQTYTFNGMTTRARSDVTSYLAGKFGLNSVTAATGFIFATSDDYLPDGVYRIDSARFNGFVMYIDRKAQNKITISSSASQDKKEIVIRAKGTPVNGKYPKMSLKYGDQILANWTVTNTSKDYSVEASYNLKNYNLSVHFTNDAWNKTQDRNLFVDYIKVDDKVYQSEDPSVYSKGSWDSKAGCGPGYKEGQWLHCNGYFEYQTKITKTTPEQVRVGRLVNLPDGTIALVGNNVVYGFPTLAIFDSWGYVLTQVAPANNAEKALRRIGIIPAKISGCTSPLDQIAGKCGSTISGTPSAPQMTLSPENNTVLVNVSQLFNFSSIDPNGEKLTFIVDWGDGSAIKTIPGQDISGSYGSVIGINHTWAKAGIYKIYVKVKNISDLSANNSFSVIAKESPESSTAAVYSTNHTGNALNVVAGQKEAPIFSFRVYAAKDKPINISGFEFEIAKFPSGGSVDGLVSLAKVVNTANPNQRTVASSVLYQKRTQSSFNGGTTVQVNAGQSMEFMVYADMSSSLPAGDLSITLKKIINSNNQTVTNSDSINGVISVNKQNSTPVPTPANNIIIRAKGTPVNGGYPKITLTAGSTVLGTWTVTSSLKNYSVSTTLDVSKQDLKVNFINDAYKSGQDRNLFVDYIKVNGEVYQSEDPSVYSKGSWDSKAGCGPGYKEGQWLHCNGYFEYQTESKKQASDNSVNVVVSGISPAKGSTVISSVAKNTIIGRFKIQNKGSASVTITNIKFTDSGTNSTNLDRYTLAVTAQGTNAGTDVTAASGKTSVAFGKLDNSFSLSGGSYRYMNVKISAGTEALSSGDTFQLSVAKLGDVLYSATEANLGYDGNGDGDTADTISNLYVSGLPELGIIQKK